MDMYVNNKPVVDHNTRNREYYLEIIDTRTPTVIFISFSSYISVIYTKIVLNI